MKSWTVSADLKNEPRLAGAIESARGWLEDVVGNESAPLVETAWYMGGGEGRRKIVLKLADWTWPDGVRVEFDPSELGLEYIARRKFHEVWSDLLQARNHQQLRELKQLIAAE